MLQIKQTDGLNFSTVPTTLPLPFAMMPVFHGISRAEGPSQQTAKFRQTAPEIGVSPGFATHFWPALPKTVKHPEPRVPTTAVAQCLIVDSSSSGSAATRGASKLWWYCGLSLYAAAFLVYAETWAFTPDEGYHMLAAQLIASGRIPYIDFCFPQTPLNAYWNAAWIDRKSTRLNSSHRCISYAVF